MAAWNETPERTPLGLRILMVATLVAASLSLVTTLVAAEAADPDPAQVACAAVTPEAYDETEQMQAQCLADWAEARADGQPAEDDPAFRCWEHGNLMCGPPYVPLAGTALLANR